MVKKKVISIKCSQINQNIIIKYFFIMYHQNICNCETYTLKESVVGIFSHFEFIILSIMITNLCFSKTSVISALCSE